MKREKVGEQREEGEQEKREGEERGRGGRGRRRKGAGRGQGWAVMGRKLQHSRSSQAGKDHQFLSKAPSLYGTDWTCRRLGGIPLTRGGFLEEGALKKERLPSLSLALGTISDGPTREGGRWQEGKGLPSHCPLPTARCSPIPNWAALQRSPLG